MNERIKELRKTLGLTLKEFGEKLCVSDAAISRIEKGNRNLTDQMFKTICREFNVNEDWLRNGEGDMFVQMSRDEEIASFINSVDGCNDSFKKRFIKMLSSLNESEWEVLEKVATELSQAHVDTDANNSSSAPDKNNNPIPIRAAHMKPGATQEQIDADDAIMESEDF